MITTISQSTELIRLVESTANIPITILIIGTGPNTTQNHLPALASLKKSGVNMQLLAADVVSETLVDNTSFVEYVRLDDFSPFSSELPYETTKRLDGFLSRYEVAACVISTEPSFHFHYAMWALSRELPVLMDKPLITLPGIVWSSNSYEIVHERQNLLIQRYHECKSKGIGVSVNVQRRFSPSLLRMRQAIDNVRQKTGVGVTSFQIYHGDGQMRNADEYSSVSYHGFQDGYGKLSHSGFHFLDVVSQLFSLDSSFDEKWNIEIEPIERRVSDMKYQLMDSEGFRAISYPNLKPSSQNWDFYGEVDVILNIRLSSDKETAIGSISLMHDSYSTRTWPNTPIDLYRSNGRTRQEFIHVEQGPFQSQWRSSIQNREYLNGQDRVSYLNLCNPIVADNNNFHGDDDLPDTTFESQAANRTVLLTNFLSWCTLDQTERAHQDCADISLDKVYPSAILFERAYNAIIANRGGRK